MKRFHYQLEHVLQLKRHIERQKQQELAVHLRHLQEATDVLTELQDLRLTCGKERDTLIRSGINPRDFMMFDRHQQFLKKEVERQQKQIAVVRQGVNKKQSELVDAVKEKEIYKNYRQQKWDEYKQAVLAEEQQFLDEIAMRNHHIQNSMKV